MLREVSSNRFHLRLCFLKIRNSPCNCSTTGPAAQLFSSKSFAHWTGRTGGEAGEGAAPLRLCYKALLYLYSILPPGAPPPQGEKRRGRAPWLPNPRALNENSKPFLRKERVSPLEGRKNLPFLQCYSYITTNQNLLHFVFSSVIMRNEQTREIPRLPGIDTAQASRGMYTV